MTNSILPGFVAIAYAQDSTSSATDVLVDPSPIPSPTDLLSPLPSDDLDPTATPSAIPSPTILVSPTATPSASPEASPKPSLEATPSATPMIESTSESSEDSVSVSQEKKTIRKTGSLLKETKKQEERDYVEGEVIVKFKKDKLDVQKTFGKAQAFVFERKFALEKTDEIKSSNIRVFKSKKSTEEMVKELKLDPNIEYVEPNYLRYPSAISSNDTNKDLLWGLDNVGQTVNGTTGTNDADIDAPEAWGISEGTGSVIIAIIDSGVAYNHPDLIGNMWDGTNCKDENGSFLGGCNHGYDFEDSDKTPLPTSSSHGTHIAGTIAATKNNSKGIIGVAPNTKIMALKYGFNVANEIKAIDFAIQNGAKIINASFGGGPYSQSEYDAINRFRADGGIFVAAAGNNGLDNESTHSYPSDYNLDNIISVTATDQNDDLASFSNFGSTSVDVGAPGTNIYSTIADSVVMSETFESVTPTDIPSNWVKEGTNNYWDT